MTQKVAQEEPKDESVEKPPVEPGSDVVMEFEGTTEDNYIEDDEEPDTAAGENLPLRRPSENFYLHQK